MVRLFATSASRDLEADLRRVRASSEEQVGVKVSVRPGGVTARFSVLSPDAERAFMRALSRWRRVSELLALSEWTVAALSIEREDPDAGPQTSGGFWSSARDRPIEPRCPVIDLSDRPPSVLGQPLLSRRQHPSLLTRPGAGVDE